MRWRDPDLAQKLSDRLPASIRTYPDLYAVGILLAVSLIARVRFLPRPFHGDEMITFSNMVLGRDFSGIIFGPFDSNSHLLNSLIMKAVYLAVGENPALMRLPNLVFALLAIVLLYRICAREFGRVPAFATALLLSLHPAMVLFSVWGRGYAGMVLFTLISSAAFLKTVRSFTWGRWLLCIAAGFLAGAFHLFAANILAAQALMALLIAAKPEDSRAESLSARAGRVVPTFLGPVTTLTLLTALYLPQLRLGSTESFHYPFQPGFPLALINFLGGTVYRTDLDVFSLVILAAASLGLMSLAKNRNLRTYLGLLFLAPAALFGLSYLAPVFTLHPRFFTYLLPFYCLLLVAGLINTARVLRTKTRDRGPGSKAISAAACLCVLGIAVVFVDRIKVPRGGAFVHAQRAVGGFIDDHPDALFLTNDTGFVRVRLRQERNMDRILPALGIKPIRAFQVEKPSAEIYFIYVPRKRFTKSDLVHYQGEVPPEVHYERDDRMRMFLTRNATLELNLLPRVQIYALRPHPPAKIKTGDRN